MPEPYIGLVNAGGNGVMTRAMGCGWPAGEGWWGNYQKSMFCLVPLAGRERMFILAEDTEGLSVTQAVPVLGEAECG